MSFFQLNGQGQIGKRFMSILSAFALVVLVLLSDSTQAKIKVTDDRGAVIVFESSPRRIVSLLPSLAETVCELGQCQRLIAVDRYTNWPASVKSLPKVGGGLDPNIEQIVALRPDVVLMATSTRGGDRLRALGIPVLALEPQNHADVQKVILTLGVLLEVPDANQLWKTIDAAVSAAAQSLPPYVRGTRVYFEVSSVPYAAGESSFIGETLNRLGVTNIVPAALGPFPKLNPEFVVKANPELIILGQRSLEGLKKRPGWQRIRAIQGENLCVFPAEESDSLVRPGPRIAEGARLMARCLTDKAPKNRAVSLAK